MLRQRPPRARRRPVTLAAHLELLEDRTLLSATSPAAVIDLSTLSIDQSSYSSTEILVKWSSDAASLLAADTLTSSILTGAQAQGLSPFFSGLQRITLPSGIDVETALALFQNNPFVEYAQPDYRVSIMLAPNDPQYQDMWSLENVSQTGGVNDADIDASAAWDVTTGSGSTIVAVIDTGIDINHPDLAGNLWINVDEIGGDGIDNDGNGYVDDLYGYDFINGDANPFDDQGHGTHVAGTIGAVGGNSVGIAGINWDVQLMALKFLGADGSGSQSDAIEAILYAVNNGAQIINASWGGDPFSQALFDALATARDAGVIFVTAAGNGDFFGNGINNDATPFYPANYNLDNIISVAATDHTDNLATFSNYGATTVDLAAPGVNILSTLPGGGYGLNSGTSMATPHVAGVVALVRDLHPEWTYDQVVQQVLATVDPLAQLAGLVSTGGRLNAAAAVGNPVPPPPPPPPVPLPVVEDFNDGIPQPFTPQSGAWTVSGGRYDVDPGADNDDLARIATLRLETPLPSDLEIQTTLNVDEGHLEFLGIVLQDYLTNGFVVFDYVSPSEFKFAGADMDSNLWVIGHRDTAGWHVDASAPGTVDAGVNYRLSVAITDGDTVTLRVGGVPKAAFTYGEYIVDGAVGLGSRNALAHFDDVVAQPYVPVLPGTLPISEDFADGIPDHLQTLSGLATITNGEYQLSATSGGGDGLVTFLLADPLPAALEFRATINADDSSADRFSNAFLIFDYQSPTDFKFAGAYVGADQWVIGHRDSTGWVTDAVTSAAVNPLTDYNLLLTIQDGNSVTLSVNDVPQVTHTFATSVTDGAIGLGTRNAVARYDDLLLQELTAPPPPSGVDLPLSENFDDGIADGFQVLTGQAAITSGRYVVTADANGDGVSTLLLNDPLPTPWEFQALINADPASGSRFSNAFLIFDYQSPTNFKFAGTYVGAGQWVIGHRDASGWVTDAVATGTIAALTDYSLQLVVQNDTQVTLSVNGSAKVSHTFSGSLSDGAIGVGTRNAVSRFDHVVVQEFVPPPPPPPPATAPFPLAEDFSDGVGDGFQVRAGQAAVISGRYQVAAAPSLGDGVSTINFADPLPANVELQAVINADPASGGLYSNALIIFDYQSPTDFKFAGAYVGGDQWVIGRRTSSGWTTDATATGVIDPNTDYTLRLVLEATGAVTLYVNGAAQVSRLYSGSLTDGALGVGTWNGVARFDNVTAQEFTAPPPPPPPPAASLPYSEDLSDGVADFVTVQVGSAAVASGRYQVTAAAGGGDGVSTITFADPLPASLGFDALINANAASSGLFSNAFLIFDYVSPTNFKFAGAYVGAGQWVIGHRNTSGWVTDSVTTTTITAGTDYNLRLTIQNGNQVTLSVNGLAQVSRTYSESLTDGALGVGTRNAIARFDNIAAEALSSGTQAQSVASGDTSTEAKHPRRRNALLSALSGLWTTGKQRRGLIGLHRHR